MPRDGSNIYHLPAGTLAVTDTTVDSAKYNTFTADVEHDLNTPRPVVAGGTGATNVADAMATLGGELAKQVITNYDSAVFVAGSFYSAASATNPPVAGHAFAGICTVTDAANMVIEAFDQDDTAYSGYSWVRRMKGGVWGPWVSPKLYVDSKAAVYVSDTAPTGVSPGSFWWKSDTGVLYLYYQDVDSSQWVVVTALPDYLAYLQKSGGTMTGALTLAGNAVGALDAVPKQQLDASAAAAAAGTVHYDVVQALTPEPQQRQARQNVYAAPFDAMGFLGLQHNGNCEITQLGNAAVALGAFYIIDGWQVAKNGTYAGTIQQVGDAPPGYLNSLKVVISTAQAAMAAGDYLVLMHYIEGYRCARLNWGVAGAAPLSIGFWVKAHRPGLYSGSVRNMPTANRSYVFPFTINAADTWEYKTVTIPGDVTGTWAKFNTTGLGITWSIAAGTSFVATPNMWVAGNAFSISGAVNGVAATTDTFQITGLVVLPGLEVPSADRAPFIARHLQDELLVCQRYYWRNVSGNDDYPGFMRSSDGADNCLIIYPVAMRVSNPVLGIAWEDATAGTIVRQSNRMCWLRSTNVAAGHYVVTFSANALLT